MALLVLADSAVAAPVYSLRADVSVLETYDDNVFRTSENTEADFITTLGTSIRFLAEARRTSVAATYGLAVDWFAKGTENQGQMDHDGSVYLAHQPTERLLIRIGDGARYAWSDEPLAPRAIPPPAAIPPTGPVPVPPSSPDLAEMPVGRVKQFVNTALVGFEYQYDAVTRLNGTYTYETDRFDSPSLVDTDIQRAALNGTRRVAENDAIEARLVRRWFRFGGGAWQDEYSATAVWTHDFSLATRSELSLGFTSAEDEAEGGLYVNGLTGGAAITHRGRETRYSARYDREVGASGGAGELRVSDTIGLGIAREIDRGVTAEAGVVGSRSIDLIGPGERAYTIGATAALGAALSESTSVALGYTFEREDAPPGRESYWSHVVTLSLTYTLPMLRSRQF